MCLTEFNETEYIDLIREEGREEGRKEGLEEGENRMISLIEILFSKGRLPEIARIKSDISYRKQLLKEYALD